jgi:1-acyl-sn-glycerol-3-phosphate acyltransferase
VALEEGASNQAQLRQLVSVLREGEIVGIFPEGNLQRVDRRLYPLQPGVIMLAKRTGARIVPAWLDGTPRKNHMFWHFAWPSRSSVAFGEPYQIDKKADTREALMDLRRRMVALGARIGQLKAGQALPKVAEAPWPEGELEKAQQEQNEQEDSPKAAPEN